MKKIMFNDRYGLTEAVIENGKTVTRRLLKPTKPRSLANCLKGIKYECMVDEDDNQYEAPYYVGEIVAVAQRYSSFIKPSDWDAVDKLAYSKGWNDKMFVKADLMPHQIRILDVRAERLQDITDEDCLREGIVNISNGAISLYVYDYVPHYSTARAAFAALINKISGKGTWERNPFVWRIEFELVK